MTQASPFVGQGALPKPPADLQTSLTLPNLADPARYMASPALRDAVNVALHLGMPLLVTGEPGTGKTQLAYRIAAEFGLGEVLRFDTKSTSNASDLFYQFDQVGYFAQCQLAAARNAEPPPAENFVHFHALGQAINNSLGSDARRSVVLIDEIDKAPSDFPNDLLSQLERDQFKFDVPEINKYGIKAEPTLRPIIVITSNSEKQLPDAFLRRCVYHHISVPTDSADRQQWIQSILQQRLGGTGQEVAGLELHSPAATEAIALYFKLRDHHQTEKKPSTAELLDWLLALRHGGVNWAQPLSTQTNAVRRTLSVLTKTQADALIAEQLLNTALPGNRS